MLFNGLAVLVALGCTQLQAQSAPARPLLVESDPVGDIVLDARGVPVGEVLRSIAASEGFEVVIDEGIARPLVHLNVSSEPMEDVLRQILRGRNHALIYDSDTASLDQVIVLTPSKPGRASARRGRGRGVGRNARR
jgi:hypothetical protein